MEKIIVAIDGLDYKPSVIQFAISLANRVHGHLVGIFLHDSTYHSYKAYDGETGVLMNAEDIAKGEAHDARLRKEAVEQFKNACSLQKIQYTVRIDRDIALPGLLHESIYADMLIIHSGAQFNHYPTSAPSRFMRELLENVQCPVILVPDEIKPVHKTVLLYDGSPASVYAIRQFCHMESGYVRESATVEILTVKKPSQSLHISDNKLIREYLKRHFPKALFTTVKGDPDLKIPALLKNENSGTLVVLGAYQRGAVSRWFRPSMADVLLSTVPLPLFIAHSR